jgi:hypothetical protein
MKLNVLLGITAVYLAILGIAFIVVPLAAGAGAVPADAPPALIAYLRMFGPPFLGIAVLNWTARNAGPSTARDAIIPGNVVGFGAGLWLDVWGLFPRRAATGSCVCCCTPARSTCFHPRMAHVQVSVASINDQYKSNVSSQYRPISGKTNHDCTLHS